MNTGDEQALRELVDVCHALARSGLGTSTSGNASIRLPGEDGRCAVTPTGVGMADIRIDNLSLLTLDGCALNDRRPSKEKGGHLAILRQRPDVRCVVHAHPSHAIAASTFLAVGDRLPSVTPQFVMRAGHVPVLAYHPPGSAELAQVIAQGVQQHRALLLRNHGVLVMGPTGRKALGILEELEENCRQWLWVRQGGEALNEAQVNELLNRQM